MLLSGTPAAHIGHEAGSHISLDSQDRYSTGRSSTANADNPTSPRTSSAPTATGTAPTRVSATVVARVAEPALMTSSTTATGLPRTCGCSPSGSEYSAPDEPT